MDPDADEEPVDLMLNAGPLPSVMPDQVTQLIEILLRELNARMHRSELNPAQWSALRFFARESGEGRTLTEFARFHATTRGTASQTISALQRKGLVTRSPFPNNARQVAVCVTERGHAALARDPLATFSDQIGRLPNQKRLELALILKDILFNLYNDN